ncbi:MAG: chemotaxis protein CheD [Gemmatimonadota bacterium]
MSAQRQHVKIGEIGVVAQHGVLFTIGLGSCVALILYDPGKKVGGLAHVMLPDTTQTGHPSPGRFAPTAVPFLVAAMLEAGARKRGMYARIVGGAAMFKDVLPDEGVRLGERNIAAVKAALSKAYLPLRGEDVGGSWGRSVFFDATDGSVLIRAVRRDDVLL